VVTPLAPDEWELSYNGASVSLSPSVGNWSFPCQSHYWITRDKVQWAPHWSQERIEAARKGQQWNWEDRHEIAEGERAPEAPSIRRGGLGERLRRMFSRSRA
jgi:hypothetical protein